MSELSKKIFIAGRQTRRLIQGGMGVKISTACLVLAVLECMCSGTLASVGLGYGTKENEKNYLVASIKGLIREIRKIAKNRKNEAGLFLVNIMHALTNYKDLVRVASSMPIDGIVSGAGLPLDLPGLITRKDIALIPIIASVRLAKIFIDSWKKRHNGRLPDAFIIEGPLAGGHLGYKHKQFTNKKLPKLEDILIDVVNYLQSERLNIPIVVAGGIWDPAYAALLIKLGASAIQLGTPFIMTNECSVSDVFKEIIRECCEKDIGIIESPVGMPARAVNKGIVQKITEGASKVICKYKCLKTCKPWEAPYCIARALFDAVSGNEEDGLFFCGANAWQLNKIVSVKDLVDSFLEETFFEYKKL